MDDGPIRDLTLLIASKTVDPSLSKKVSTIGERRLIGVDVRGDPAPVAGAGLHPLGVMMITTHEHHSVFAVIWGKDGMVFGSVESSLGFLATLRGVLGFAGELVPREGWGVGAKWSKGGFAGNMGLGFCIVDFNSNNVFQGDREHMAMTTVWAVGREITKLGGAISFERAMPGTALFNAPSRTNEFDGATAGFQGHVMGVEINSGNAPATGSDGRRRAPGI